MSIHYQIQAAVIDINSDTPTHSDAFLVDSNVWYWMTYTNAGHNANNYQLLDYSCYINKALDVGSKVYYTGLSLAELSHLIEKTEREIFERLHFLIRPKEYRHNQPGERNRIVSEVQTAWAQVKSLADFLFVIIDEPNTEAALKTFYSERVDGYDLFILETMKNHNVTQIITDDSDFSTIPNVQVFTSNRNVLSSAKMQNKLLTR